MERAEIYACLCVLMNEGDRQKFNEGQILFLEYWREKQAGFIKYYESEYAPRSGYFCKHIFIVII